METLSTKIEELMNDPDFNNIDLPEGLTKDDVKPLIVLLSLSDKEFAVMAPLMLSSIETEIRKPEYINKILLDLKHNQSTVEDLKQSKEVMINLFKEANEISAEKIEFLGHIFDLNIMALEEAEGRNALISVPIEFINDNAKMPAYAHQTDAGMDVYALEDITIAPGETKLIPLGFKVAIPAGYELQVRPKSGRCLQTKLRIANAPGTIDAGYRDEVGVIIDNIDPPIKKFDGLTKIYTASSDGVTAEPTYVANIEYGSSYTIGKGEKFAQLVLAKLSQASFSQVEDVNIYGEDRGGGFGSTTLY